MQDAIKRTIRNIDVQQNIMAQDLILSIAKRSIADGIDYNGSEGVKTTYSKKSVKATYLYSQIINQGGRAYLKGKRYANWGAFRKAQGLNNRFVNLRYTGKFWNSHTVARIARQNCIVYRGEMRKFKELTGYFGNFYQLRNSDLLSIKQKTENEFYKSCKRNF